MFIKKGDTVQVISGDGKGATGQVLKVLVKDGRNSKEYTYTPYSLSKFNGIKEQRVIVEGVNKVSRHTRPNQANPDGGIIQKEAPIAISNVMYYEVVDGKGQTTRIGYKLNANGKKVRYSIKSGKELDK